jgi:glycerophosphoryl diester phosphodiesterase
MKTLFEAHRGVSTEYPENTMPAFRAALDEGYDYIEADPDYTKDKVAVVFHDWPDIRRTCRNPDGSEIKEKIAIRDLTYDEAINLDAGLFMGEKFAGTKIPKLEELLQFSKENNIPIKIDNRIQTFDEEILELMLGIIESSGAPVSITSSEISFIEKIVKRLPGMTIHYDGVVNEAELRRLKKVVGDTELYVWISLDTPITKWVKVPHASEELCTLIKKYAKLGIWILNSYEEPDEAIAFGADIIETTGAVKPKKI